MAFSTPERTALRLRRRICQHAAVQAPLDARPASVSSEWILGAHGRPLFIYAHQDDETVMAGMIRRVVGADERGCFIWWTNGDGLAPEAKIAPDRYAEIRIAEATEALRRLGASAARKVDLASSEIENYRKMTEVLGPGRRAAIDYFLREAERVEAAIREADPDRVFLLAWQGGHPEHDLVHLMTVRAVRRLRQQSGRPIPVVQAPAYEYVIACPLRFKPWYRGDVRGIWLDAGELEAKRAVFEAYPSQQELLRKFRRVIELLGQAGRVVGRGFDAERYLAKEQFGVLEPELDYRRSTHRWDRLNYIGDHFEGTPIRFQRMIRPLAEAILGS
jgi:LmbE family N-acetylglucosaminyl deacetylase